MPKEKKISVMAMKKAVGPCPRCGAIKTLWLNDVPLRAFCWGTEEKPHKEWHKIIPRPFNPYLPA